jgi:FdhD protein
MEALMVSNNGLIPTMQYSASLGWKKVDAQVIGESTLTLSVNGYEWIRFQCTPLAQVELACGFLFNEGFIETKKEIADVQLCQDGTHVDIWLNHSVSMPESWKRTSGCGGGATHQAAPLKVKRNIDNASLEPKKILALMEMFQESQELYRETGGIHSSALSDGESIVQLCEDIGRHNTLDKLAGYLLFHPREMEQRVILTTGRISSEMLQKALRLRANLVVSRTSPTVASIQLAEQAGITLAGYARRSQMTIYTQSPRVDADLQIQ